MNWSIPTLGNSEGHLQTYHTCCTDKFVPLVAITQQKGTPPIRHDPARRNFVQDKQVEDTMPQLQEPFSDSLIEDHAIIPGEALPVGREAWRGTLAGTGHPPLVTGAGAALSLKTKMPT